MLTGARAYEGDDVTDTMAAILRGEPDWTRMPAEVPGALVRVVKRCLEKDRRQRRHDIADVRMDIDDAMTAPSVNGATTVARRWTTGHLAAGAAAILVAAGIGAAIAWNARPASPPPMVRRSRSLWGRMKTIRTSAATYSRYHRTARTWSTWQTPG
jgi:serine/threonine-protein kinase